MKWRLQLWRRSGAVLLVAQVLGQSFCMAAILACSIGHWSGSGARPGSEGKARESRANLRTIGSLALSCRVTLRSRTHNSIRIRVAYGVADAALLWRYITTCSGRSDRRQMLANLGPPLAYAGAHGPPRATAMPHGLEWRGLLYRQS